MSSPAANISFHFKVVYKILRVFLSFLQHYSPAPHQFILYCTYVQSKSCMQLVNQYMQQSTTQQHEMSLHIINNVYILQLQYCTLCCFIFIIILYSCSYNSSQFFFLFFFLGLFYVQDEKQHPSFSHTMQHCRSSFRFRFLRHSLFILQLQV